MNAPEQATSSGREALLERLAGGGAETSAEPAPHVRTFGDRGAEYRALKETAGLLEEGHRSVIRVRPGRKEERTQEVLAGLLTNHYGATGAGEALYSFLLTPQGNPVAELRALNLGGEHWLDVPAACRAGALSHLEKYLPPLFARFDPTDTVRLSVVGPRTAEALAPAVDGASPRLLNALEVERVGLSSRDAVIVRREEIEGPGFDLYLPAGSVEPAWEALSSAVERVGGRPAGRAAFDVWRVERGVPVYGADISEENLPQETGQADRAISFDKGCYTGQEVVIRIHHRGHVNRRLRGFAFDGPLPDPGAELYAGERARGTVTSPASSPDHGAIALGYARREVEPGDGLSLEPGGAEACRVVELPFEAPPAAG